MNEKFSFYAPAFLMKSGNPSAPIKVGGLISSESKDLSNETVLSKGLVLDIFNGGRGKIKYEHDNEFSKEPDNIIGFPIRTFQKSGKLYFEGELIPFEGIPEHAMTPQQKTAKSAYGLLKSIDDWNSRHPENLQKAGWSIEGSCLKNNAGIVRKAIISNVVLTTKPVNNETFATLMKSLEVGYGMTPQTQTGFGATRKESIDRTIKNQSGDGKMFKSRKEAYETYLTQGMSETEAKKKAMETEIESHIAKSLNASKDCFASATETLKEVDSFVDETEPAVIKKSLDDSLNAMKNSEDGDITKYFEAKQEADLAAVQSQQILNQKVDLLAKSLASIAEGLGNLVGGNEYFAKSLEFVNQATRLNSKGITMLIKGRQDTTLSTDSLDQFSFEDNIGEKQLTKSQRLDVLDKLVDEGAVSSRVASAAEANLPIPENIERMIKSRAKDFFK